MPEIEPIFVPVQGDFKQLRADLKAAEKEARASGRIIGSGVGAGLAEGSRESKTFIERLKGIGQAAAGVAGIVAGKLLGALKGVAGIAGRATNFLIDFNVLGLLAIARGARKMAEDIAAAEGAVRHFAPVITTAATAAEGLAKVLVTVSGILTGLKVAAAAAAATIVILAHRAEAEFAPAFQRVVTILGRTNPAIRQIRSDVSELAGVMGVEGVEAADAFYQILSALPQLANEPARALEILRVALEAGSTGFTNAAEAGDAITAILNAFSLEAEDARRVSDALFAAQDQGVLTFGEVAQSIGRVSDLTASLNGRFEDLLGIAATLTPSGTSVAEVFTGVRSAIANILKPSADAEAAAEELGVQFDTAALQAKGLNGFLLDIIETTEGNTDTLARFFGGQEALSLVVALANRTDELRQKTDLVGNSAGSTAEKVGIMNESWSRQREILSGLIDNELRQLGSRFEGIGVDALKALNSVLRFFNGASEAAEGFQGKLDSAADGIRDFFLRLTRGLDDLPRLDPINVAVDRRPRPGAGILSVPNRLGPRAGTSIPRPDEPTSVEFSQERIAELESALQLKAVAELARTGDLQAYQAAVRSAQEAVNELVVAELDRLRAAGVAETELAKLAESYRVVGNEAEDAARKIDLARQRVEAQAAVARSAQDAGLGGNLLALPDSILDKLRAIVQLEEQIGALASDIAVLGGDVPEGATAALDQLMARLRELRDTVSELSDPPAAVAELATIAQRAAPALQNLVETGLDPITAGLRTLEAATRNAEAAEAGLTAARLSGDPARIAQAEARLADARNRVVSITRDLAGALSDAGLSNDVVTAIVAAIEKALRDAGIQLEDLTGKTSSFAATLSAVETAGRGLVAIADSMGLIDEQTRRAATGVLDLVAGFQQLQASQGVEGLAGVLGTLSGAGAVLGAVAGIGSALIGGGLDRQRIDEIERNTEAIRDLADRIQSLVSEIGPLESAVTSAIDAALEVARNAIQAAGGTRIVEPDARTIPQARESLQIARQRVEEQRRRAPAGERGALDVQLAEIDRALAELDEFFARLREQAEQDLAIGLALAEGRTGDAAALELRLEREAKLRDLQAAGLDDLIPKYQELFRLQDEAAARQFEHEEQVELLRIQGFEQTAAALERQNQREQELAAARTDAERATIAARHAEEDLALQRDAQQGIDELTVTAFGTPAEQEAFRAQQQFNESVLFYTDLLKAGIIDQDQFAQAMEAIGAIFNRTLSDINDEIRDFQLSFDAELAAGEAERAGRTGDAETIRFEERQRQERREREQQLAGGRITEEQFERFIRGQEADREAFLRELGGSTSGRANAGRLERGGRGADTVVSSLQGATHTDFVTAADLLRSSLQVHRDQLARLISIDSKTPGIAAGGSATAPPRQNGGGATNNTSYNAPLTIEGGLHISLQTPAISTANARQVGDQISDAMVDGLERRLGQRFSLARGNAGRLER